MSDDGLISGRYRLEGRLGTGGMSTVQRAMDVRLERPVAVKLLAEHLAEDPAFVARFQREALAAARLIHPNVVQVYDSGLDEASHRHYIVMELVNGPSGAEILREQGILSVDETLSVVGQACRGLDYAHRNGVIHRDVKPGNLLRDEEGVVKLADFGIAKATEQSSITQIGSVLGTAAYLAPEQARGEEAGAGADIYSLGVVAYQLLAGRVPWEAQSLTELAIKQQNEAPVPLDQLNPEVGAPLARAIERALAPSPQQRYETAAAMGDAWRAAARGIAPAPAPPSGDETFATRVLGRGDATAATVIGSSPREQDPEPTYEPNPIHEPAPYAEEPVPARRPREPSRRAAPRPAPAPRQRDDSRDSKPRKHRFRRFLLVLALLALVIGGGVAAVLSQSNTSDRARVQQIVITQVKQGVDDLKSYIQANTK